MAAKPHGLIFVPWHVHEQLKLERSAPPPCTLPLDTFPQSLLPGSPAVSSGQCVLNPANIQLPPEETEEIEIEIEESKI